MKTAHQFKKNPSNDRFLLVTCLVAVFGLSGCQQEGTAEKAGQKIDRAAERAEKEIEETTEKAGQEVQAAKKAVVEKAETAGEYIDDSVITMKVKAALIDDPLLKASQIEVTTEDGVVTLSGTVDSEEGIARARELATGQKNVKSVQTNLVVNEAAPGVER